MRGSHLRLALAALVAIASLAVAAGCGSSSSDDSGGGIKTVKDLTSSSKVAVQQGTTGQDYAEKNTPAKVQKFKGVGEAFNALQAGQVDAVINDYAVSQRATKKYPQLEVVQTIPTGEKYGFPVQKSNKNLLAAVNAAFANLVADGTYEKLFKKYFNGGTPPKEFLPDGADASTEKPDTSDLGLLTDGELLVGSDIPYPPYEMGSPPDYTGFDIELVDAMAKILGVTPKIQVTSFDTIFSDLQAGKFDMVASSTTITPEREKQVAFSTPYFNADQSLMVQK